MSIDKIVDLLQDDVIMGLETCDDITSTEIDQLTDDVNTLIDKINDIITLHEEQENPEDDYKDDEDEDDDY